MIEAESLPKREASTDPRWGHGYSSALENRAFDKRHRVTKFIVVLVTGYQNGLSMQVSC